MLIPIKSGVGFLDVVGVGVCIVCVDYPFLLAVEAVVDGHSVLSNHLVPLRPMRYWVFVYVQNGFKLVYFVLVSVSVHSVLLRN